MANRACGRRGGGRHGRAAGFTGKLAESRGRKPLLIAAFAFLALRNGLTVVSHNPWYLISLQALDGIAAGIYGILLTLVTADLARRRPVQFPSGDLQSAMRLGGFMSMAFGFGGQRHGLQRQLSRAFRHWRGGWNFFAAQNG